jgi:hypothetical protein
MIIATEYAADNVKSSAIGFFSSIYMVQHYIILIQFTDQGIRNVKDTQNVQI